MLRKRMKVDRYRRLWTFGAAVLVWRLAPHRGPGSQNRSKISRTPWGRVPPHPWARRLRGRTGEGLAGRSARGLPIVWESPGAEELRGSLWATSPGGVGGAVGQRKRKRSGLADEGLAKRGVRELERAEAGRSARLRSGLTYDLYIHTQRLRVFVLLVRIRVGALPRTSPVACGVAMAERALIHVHVHTCIVYTVRDGNEMACGSCWSAPSYMYGIYHKLYMYM